MRLLMSRASITMITSTPTVLIFSYGTLQDKSVQVANFGRELSGRTDALPGYVRRLVAHHANAEPSADPDDAVLGTAFEITEAELACTDQYEAGDHYRRISVTLSSGDRAWVYVHKP
jgi:gamma-glutamylcyclotransferase (GGCT)/AIG2-like uncharacterized protein YtfP